MLLEVEYIKIPKEIFFSAYWILIILSIVGVYLLSRKKYNFFSKAKFLKYILYFALGIVITIIMVYDVIEIYIITGRSYAIGMLYMLITTIVIGMLILILGIAVGKDSNSMSYMIVLMMVLFSISGIGYIGMRIDFNVVEFLSYIGFFQKTFETNGLAGILFYGQNIIFFTLLIFVSTIFEKGGKND